MKDLQQKCNDYDTTIRELNDEIMRLNVEVNSKKNLDEAILYLKDEL